MDIQIHPIIVHFPIVLLIIGVITLWISYWKSDFFERVALYSLISGFLGLVAAVISGNLSINYAESQFSPNPELLSNHQMFGILTTICFAVTLIILLIRKKKKTTLGGFTLFVFSLLGLILLFISGHYGGQIVYS